MYSTYLFPDERPPPCGEVEYREGEGLGVWSYLFPDERPPLCGEVEGIQGGGGAGGVVFIIHTPMHQH